jgi:endonuclease/exonuclease/phosphatase (EEP) superfamily protein YafD
MSSWSVTLKPDRMTLLVARLGLCRYWAVWLGTVPLCLWALVRLAGLDEGTPLVPLLAFTPLAALAAFLLAGVCVALRCWAAAILTGLALACLAVAVLPRAFGQGESVPTGAPTIKVLSANLYYGRAEPQSLLKLVAEQRPDLLVVQELTPTLAAALRRGGIEHRFHHTALALPRRGFGRAVYSRLPLRRLGETVGHPGALAPLAVSLAYGRTVRLVNFHPHPPKPGRVGRWEDALKRLPAAGAGPPWLLVGDFNATFDQSAFRAVLARGYRDAGKTTGNGLKATWPANKVVPPLVTIDHVLADRRVGIATYGVAGLAGSDHKAIFATLFLR